MILSGWCFMTAINNNKKISCPHNVDKGEWLHQTNVRVLMLHKGNNHSKMYLWHNHQRTLWFERRHSEKPTDFYNLRARVRRVRCYRGFMIQHGSMWKNWRQSSQDGYGSDLSPTLTLNTVAETRCLVNYTTQRVSLAWTVLEPREILANQHITAQRLPFISTVWH